MALISYFLYKFNTGLSTQNLLTESATKFSPDSLYYIIRVIDSGVDKIRVAFL